MPEEDSCLGVICGGVLLYQPILEHAGERCCKDFSMQGVLEHAMKMYCTICYKSLTNTRAMNVMHRKLMTAHKYSINLNTSCGIADWSGNWTALGPRWARPFPRGFMTSEINWFHSMANSLTWLCLFRAPASPSCILHHDELHAMDSEDQSVLEIGFIRACSVGDLASALNFDERSHRLLRPYEGKYRNIL